MLEILTAIQQAFNANTYLSAIFANGLEVAIGADAEATPTCILAIISSMPGYVTCGTQNQSTGAPIRFYTETVDLQFTVYSSNGNTCAAVLDQIIRTFDHVPLTLVTEKWLDGRRSGLGRITSEDVREARGDIQFTFITQRQLGS
jgi:hypothetical protein